MAKHLLVKHKINLLEETENNPPQINIKKLLANKFPYADSSAQFQKRLDAVFDFVVRTGQPISLMDNKQFVKLLAVFDDKFKLPTRQYFSNELIVEKYNKFCNSLATKMKCIDYCGITTDCWSSNANHSYMGVTIHFVDDEYKFRSVEVALKYLIESHTSQYLKDQIMEVLTRFGIENKVIAGSSDTANNIKHTMEDLMTSLLYVPCFCHKLNLLVKDVIQSEEHSNIKRILAKCRKLVGLFKHSNLLSEQLSCAQRTNNLPVNKLNQEVTTRWNSTYLMIQSILSSYQSISLVLLDPANSEHNEHRLSGSDIDFLTKLAEFLQPLFYLTTKLSVEKFPPCSLIIPSIGKLHSFYKDVEKSDALLEGKIIQNF